VSIYLMMTVATVTTDMAAVIATADKETRIAVAMIRATAADVTPEAMVADRGRQTQQTEARQREIGAAAVAGGAGALGLAAEIVDVTDQKTWIEAKTERRIGIEIEIEIVGDDTGIEIAIVVETEIGTETGTGKEVVMTNARPEIVLPTLTEPGSSSSVSFWDDRSPAKFYTEF